MATQPPHRALSAATVNRYLASLASVLNFALKKGIIDTHPMKGGKVEKLTESRGRKPHPFRGRAEPAADQGQGERVADVSDLYLWMCVTTGGAQVRGSQSALDCTYNSIGTLQFVDTKNGDSRALPLVR